MTRNGLSGERSRHGQAYHASSSRPASTGAFQSRSGRDDDSSADVAVSCLRECLRGASDAVAGGDRNLKLPVPESLRKLAQLISVRADVDAGG